MSTKRNNGIKFFEEDGTMKDSVVTMDGIKTGDKYDKSHYKWNPQTKKTEYINSKNGKSELTKQETNKIKNRVDMFNKYVEGMIKGDVIDIPPHKRPDVYLKIKKEYESLLENIKTLPFSERYRLNDNFKKIQKAFGRDKIKKGSIQISNQKSYYGGFEHPEAGTSKMTVVVPSFKEVKDIATGKKATTRETAYVYMQYADEQAENKNYTEKEREKWRDLHMKLVNKYHKS